MPRAALALTLAALIWTAALVAAPPALAHPGLAVPAAVVYAASARLCHQRPERSFALAGRQMPVCARCLGLYVAGALGAAVAWGSRRRPGPEVRRLIAVAAVPTAVTWTTEVLGLAGWSNVIRAAAALPLGLAGGWVFVQLLRYDAPLDAHQVDDRRSRVRGG